LWEQGFLIDLIELRGFLRIVWILFLFFIQSISLYAAFVNGVSPFGAGVLNITNQSIPRIYYPGTPSLILDSQMVFEFDYDLLGPYSHPQATIDQSTWRGGAIYVTMDQAADTDFLACIPANVLITSVYSVPSRMLTITVPVGVTYGEIQSTLRTLFFTARNLYSFDRVIRIWVESAGYKFVLSRGGRVYGNVEARVNYPASSGVMTWDQAYSDLRAQAKRYGLAPYFASITTDAEKVAAQSAIAAAGQDSWVGGRTIAPGSVPIYPTDPAINYLTTAIPLGSYSSAPWYWIDGPDRGVNFWNGAANGSAPSPLPNFWRALEPNGGFTGGAALYVSGTALNDNTVTATYQNYLAEYGGMPSDENFVTVKVIAPNTFKVIREY